MIRVAFLTAAFVVLVAFAVRADTWSSTISKVSDGDTFWLSRPLIKIRLCGVDTPERGRPGYKEATDYLKQLVAGKVVQCRPVGEGTPCDGRSFKKSGKRFVAQCFVGGKDIGMELVKSGHACAWRKYSGRHYVGSANCVR